VSTYAYVNPTIAVALGAIFLDERIAAATVAGMVLVVASVAVIVRREARRGPPPSADEPPGPSQLHEDTETATVATVSSRN
jgi:hypothetical protein